MNELEAAIFRARAQRNIGIPEYILKQMMQLRQNIETTKTENAELARQNMELREKVRFFEAAQTLREIGAEGRWLLMPIIKKAVAKKTQLSAEEIEGPSRYAEVVRARQIVCYLAKKYTLLSLPQIAQRIGGRDHTTVLHGMRKIEQLRLSDPELDRTITELEIELRGINETVVDESRDSAAQTDVREGSSAC